MILPFLFVIASVVLFYFGTNWLIKSGSTLATKTGLSHFVFEFIITPLILSLPGLSVSLNSAISGHGNIAVGNIIGSNLFNICIVLGVAAFILPLSIKARFLKLEIAALVLAAMVFAILFADRQINQFEGIILVSALVLCSVLILFQAGREDKTEISEDEVPLIGIPEKWWVPVSFLAFSGIIFIAAGSELLMLGAIRVATILGIGITIISITLISAVSGLPLLVFTILAVRKKQSDMAFAGILGSGVFNIMGIGGIVAIIHPLRSISISNIDLYVMIGLTLFLLPFLRPKYIFKRDEGIFMLGIYLVYIYYLWPK